MNISAGVIRVSIYCIDFIDRLHIVGFDILVILIVLFLYIFLNAALIDYNYRDHCAMNLNSMSVTAFVCNKKFEPGTPGSQAITLPMSYLGATIYISPANPIEQLLYWCIIYNKHYFWTMVIKIVSEIKLI